MSLLGLQPNFSRSVTNPSPRTLAQLLLKIQSCFVLKSASENIMNEVAYNLQEFGNEGVQAIVDDILQDENLLSKLAKDSYLHKNGFYKLLLANEKDFCIRFHIWMPGINSKETLHNHRWYIASTITNGTLHSEIWEDSASIYANYYDEYMYTNKYVDPSLIGKARVEFVKTDSYETGSSYVLQPHILHRIISNGDEMVATLICHSSNGCGWSRNIILNGLVPDVIPNYMSTEQLYRLLEDYKKLNDGKKFV